MGYVMVSQSVTVEGVMRCFGAFVPYRHAITSAKYGLCAGRLDLEDEVELCYESHVSGEAEVTPLGGAYL